ncbi:MAG: hypothetical protein ACYS8W_00535 [Planctomycetota bacterium]
MTIQKAYIQIIWVFFLLGGCASQPVFDAVYPTPLQSRHAVSIGPGGIDFTEDLARFVSPPTGPGDAAEHYVVLFILYTARSADGIDPDGQGVAELLRGAACARCSVGKIASGVRPTPDLPIPVVEVLTAYANAAIERAKNLYEAGLVEDAEDVLRAVCNCGKHLAGSDDDLAFVIAGVKILRMGAFACAGFPKASAGEKTTAAAGEFLKKLAEKENALRRKYRALSDYIEFASLKACIDVAGSDPAPMWRREACIGLALFSFGALGVEGESTVVLRNDEMEVMAAEALMQVAEGDSDKTVRKLAKWCVDNITADDLESVRLGPAPAEAGDGGP